MKSFCLYFPVLLTSFFLLSTSSVFGGILILNGLSHIHEGQEGQTLKGQIVVRNAQSTEQDVKLYLRDYYFNANGESFFPEIATQPRSNAKWIDVSETYVTLNPMEERTIDYEISIPNGVEMDGTFWSVILVEGIVPPDPNMIERGLQVNTVMRYAVQVVTNLGETGSKELQFTNYDVEKKEDATSLLIEVENTGERLLIPELQVELYDASGSKIGIYNGGKKKLYPNTSQKFAIPIQDIPEGTYQALVLADSPDADIFGANLTVELE